MSQFTVRIELHEAQWTDYETLHAAMENRGFSRLITSDDGRRYRLPLAEYNGTANLTSRQVHDIALGAAKTTGKANAVLVTEAIGRTWSGLTSVRS